MEHFKFIENRYIFFIYSFFIGSTGLVFLFYSIVYILFLPKFDFTNYAILIMFLFQLINRLVFNYFLVSSIEEKENGLEIIYIRNGILQRSKFLLFEDIIVLNKIAVPVEIGFWSNPVRIEFSQKKYNN